MVNIPARRDRDQKRRRVLYFPNEAINEEIARAAAENGFVHKVSCKDGEQPNVAAYVLWLHRQYMRKGTPAVKDTGLIV